MRVSDFIEGIEHCAVAFTTLERLYAVRMLGRVSIDEKHADGAALGRFAAASRTAYDYLNRHYRCQNDRVFWPVALNPASNGILDRGRIDVDRLDAVIEELASTLHFTIDRLLDTSNRYLLFNAASDTFRWLKEAVAAFPPVDGDIRELLRMPASASEEPYQAVRGPMEVFNDPAFEPAYSLMNQNTPKFGETVIEVAPYLWCLATRETLASELCALSAFEYDALPIAFYHDMAKQCLDEIRHAKFYFEASVRLLPDFLEAAGIEHPLHGPVTRFLQTGTGLPIPLEGRLYESMLNSDLIERLVLMNVRTEAPAVGRLRAQSKSPFCRLDDELARAFEIDTWDEITHARIGTTWLRYLVPDHEARKQVVARVDELRSMLILTSFAHHGPRSLTELMRHYMSVDEEGIPDVMN